MITKVNENGETYNEQLSLLKKCFSWEIIDNNGF